MNHQLKFWARVLRVLATARVLLQPMYTGEPSEKSHSSVVSSSKEKSK